jgi:hypothetical protein
MDKQQLIRTLQDRFAVGGTSVPSSLIELADDLRTQARLWSNEIVTCRERNDLFLMKHYQNEQQIDRGLLREVEAVFVEDFLTMSDDDMAREFDEVFGDPVEKAFDLLVAEGLLE